jgi:acetyl-CoA carboxylase carboxyl transferase subunit alpha
LAKTFLDFEQPIAGLEGKIEGFATMQTESAGDIFEELSACQEKSAAHQGHLQRSDALADRKLPSSRASLHLDYVRENFLNFVEMHGDHVFKLPRALSVGWRFRISSGLYGDRPAKARTPKGVGCATSA